MHISKLRELLSIPAYHQKPEPAFPDLFLFLFWLFIGVIYSLASIIVLPFIIGYNIFLFANGKKKK